MTDALTLFEDRVAIVMRVRNLPQTEAKRAAYEIILVEFLNRTHPNTDPNRCALCGNRESPGCDSVADRRRRSPHVAALGLLLGMACVPAGGGNRSARGDGDRGAMTRLVQKERWKPRRKAKPPAASARASVDQARTDEWIRDRLVDWRESCLHCRRSIVVGQVWTVISNGEVSARFHQRCHDEWRVQQEVAAGRALGLDRNRCAQQDPDAVCASGPQ